MSYRKHYYHIVFGTKHRKHTLPDTHCELLYKYIWGFVDNKKSKLYRINGSTDHIHLLLDIHPSIGVATFIQNMKVATSLWLKQQVEFRSFEGWAEGYASFTITHNDQNRVREYIINQKIHHQTVNFRDEYIALLKEHGIEFDESELD